MAVPDPQRHRNQSIQPRHPTWNEVAWELEAQLVEAQSCGCGPHAHTQTGGKAQAAGGGLIERHEAQQVGCQDGAKESGCPAA